MTLEVEALQGLDHWRNLSVAQQPTWPDQDHLRAVTDQLATVPPLVFPREVDRLRDQLGAAGRGEAFLLQGGDCAEIFAGATASNIRNKIKTLLQMAVVLTYGASLPVIKMGRMGGQYAKPRSSDSETRDGVTLPAFRGDIVNGFEFTPEARIPDANRLLEAYHTSAATVNLIRSLTSGGFASLQRVHEWNKGFTANPAYARYEEIAAEIDRAIKFMAACGADFSALDIVDFFTSHEGLLLDYERPLTRLDAESGNPYALSAHFIWIGERTRQLDGGHLDFFSRIHNPIGIKLGPTTSPDDVKAIIDKLNPQGIPGRLTLVSRMGAPLIREKLPALVAATKADGRAVTWICDPMHGNGFTSATGFKTRRFVDIMDEVAGFFEVHRAAGTVPGGIHIENTGDDVTEVLGGTEEIDDDGLAARYETLVDPRLNHQQSLELAYQVVELLRN